MPDNKEYTINEEDFTLLQSFLELRLGPNVRSSFFPLSDEQYGWFHKDHRKYLREEVRVYKDLYNRIVEMFDNDIPKSLKPALNSLEYQVKHKRLNRINEIRKHKNFTEEQKLDFKAGVITYSGIRYIHQDGGYVYRDGTGPQ